MQLQKYIFFLIGFLLITLKSSALQHSDMNLSSSNDTVVAPQYTDHFLLKKASTVDSVINYGKLFLNKPYRYGSSGADSFDCSGYTSFVYRNFGYNLEHSSAGQAAQFDAIKRNNLKAGDLVYFAGSRKSKRIGHVGIVVDSSADGKFSFIHAASDRGITISSSEEPYYSSRFIKANRVIGGTPLKSVMPVISENKDADALSDISVPLTTPGNKVKKTIPAKYHKVKSGETLSSIAAKYDLTIAELKNLNGLIKTKLSPKQRLKVKASETYTEIEPVRVADNKSKEDEKSFDEGETKSVASTHVVKKGESLFSISKLYNVSVEELKKLNNLEKGSLRLGQELKLNNSGAAENQVADNPSTLTTHKVISGESLFSIAKMYDVSVEDLKKINDLNAGGIHAGQVLKITLASKNTAKFQKPDEFQPVSQVVVAKQETKIPSLKPEAMPKSEFFTNPTPKLESNTEPQRVVKAETGSEVQSESAPKLGLKARVIAHKVHAGENLMTIARDFKVSVDELKKINNLDGTKLSNGQEILICINMPSTGINHAAVEAPVVVSTPVQKQSAVEKPVLEPKQVSIARSVAVIEPTLKPDAKQKNTFHKVHRGENLNSIAEEYHISIDELKRINNLQGTKISVGQQLLVAESKATSGNLKELVVKSDVSAKLASHKVKKGETLNSIAKANNTTIDELKRINNLSQAKLKPGQVIKIGSEASESEEIAKTSVEKSTVPAKLTSHKVKKGETLNSIAKANNTTIDELKRINNLSQAKLKPGQVIKISSGASGLEEIAKTLVEKSTVPAKLTSHKVKKGETLGSIAKANNTTIDELKRINNLSQTKLTLGQVIKIGSEAPESEEIAKTSVEKSTVPAKLTSHKVKKGETLGSIAKANNTTIDELKRINNLSQTKLKPGQVIKIGSEAPGSEYIVKAPIVKSAVPTKPASHRVKKGETLGSIAKANDISIDELKRMNNLSDSKLKLGQELKLVANSESAEVVKEAPAKAQLPNKTVSHKVKKGETIKSIAHDYNMTVDELKEINGLTSTKLQNGQKLIVNQSTNEKANSSEVNEGHKESSKRKVAHYKVKPGDSYYTIAEKYGCTVKDLKEWNNKTGNKLKPGIELEIRK
jgi:LysM repeat protein